MDFLASLGQTPLSATVPYITATIAIATILLNVMPPPGGGASAAYTAVWNFVHLVANLKSPPAAPGSDVPATSPKTLPSWAPALMLAATVSLGACTAAEEQQALGVIRIACDADGVVQPVLLSLAPVAGAGGAAAAGTDAMLVHPAVVRACAAVNAIPVATEALAPAAVKAPQ